METKVFLAGDTLLVSFGEELDHHQAGKIKGKIDREIMVNRVKNVVMDFSATKFMDSSGIGIVIGRYKLLRGVGGTVTIVHAGEQVKKVFELAGIYEYVRTADNIAGVLEKFAGRELAENS
ncbi:MAG: anti-sigma factor antagonist [Lachnospiraceae bacterium]|nr:anti-sigma factor antagonist [Lachnospiraceae bacterium]